MVPYALFMFRIICPDTVLDIRALELTGNGFRFRIADKRKEDIKKQLRYAACFWNTEKNSYDEYEICGTVEEDGDLFAFRTEDERFKEDLRRLNHDYMHMVSVKMENSELDAMEELSGISLSDEFENDVINWKRKFLRIREADFKKLLPAEIGISLDNEIMWDAFLKMDTEKFLEYYWRENCLEECAALNERVTHIYIGNQYCPHLFPDESRFEKIFARITDAGKIPVIAFAPNPENLLDRAEKIINKALKLGMKYGRHVEFVINDYGTAELVRITVEETENYIWENIALTAGVMLNKRKKDPRIAMCSKRDLLIGGNTENMFNDRIVTDYLTEELKISAMSAEVCGYETATGNMDMILHLPLYQTNSSDCVMNSLCSSGDRGVRRNTSECLHFCLNNFIYYPDNIPLIGIGNSVFSVSGYEINNIEYLNRMISRGVKRMVFRL